MEKGLVHIYTGDGKGKSTAACGIALRALGQGFNVLFIQFLKSGESGEITKLKTLNGIEVLYCENTKKFIWDMDEAEKKIAKMECENLLKFAVNQAENYDIIILDEIMAGIHNNMLELEEIIKFIKNRPIGLELILTGRKPPVEILNLADYISEVKMIRHPFEKGIQARRGIEF